jgi:hypothetical protein
MMSSQTNRENDHMSTKSIQDAGAELTQNALDNLTSTRVPALTRYNHEEAVSHPQHYGGDTTYEAIKVIQAWGAGFEVGSALKYLCRAGKKPGADYIEDLEKAQFYLQAEIDRVRAQS